MKKMKKLLSWVLTLVLVIGMMQGMTLTAQAVQIFVSITVSDTTTTFDVDVELTDTVDAVKAKIADKKGYSADLQTLTYNGTTLEGNKTLQDYGITKDATLILTLAESVTNYPLYVAGTQVTSANASNITGADTAVASYDADSNTLTLNGFTYSGNSAGINYTGSAALNISFEGTNSIENSNSDGAGILSKNGALNFSGKDGSLNTQGNNGIDVYSGGITISGGTVTATGTDSDGILSDAGDVIISGGIVNATGKNGIELFEGNITVSGGTVTATGTTTEDREYYGIVTGSGNVTISGGTVTATGTATGGYDNGYGIKADNIVISNTVLSLTASGNGIAISGTLKNAIAGTGWTNVDGTGDAAVIAVNTSGDDCLYKKVQFTATTYTVTFDVNGHGTAPDSQTVVSGGLVTEPDDLTADGYTFGGWYKDTDCTKAWDFASDTVTADTTLYAKWTAVDAAAPTISVQPQDLELTYGYTEGSISVTAEAAEDTTYSITYQWYSNEADSNENGTAIEGATGAGYTIPTGKTVGTEYYYCVVTATRSDNSQTASIASSVAKVTIARAGNAITLKSAASVELKVRGTSQISASVTNGTLSYRSSDELVATVSGDGLITAGSATGSATITISATPSDSNYETPENVALSVTVIEKETIILTVTQEGTTYGTSLSNAEISNGPEGVKAGDYTYFNSGTTLAGETYSESDAPTEAGSYTLTVSYEDDNYYYSGSADFTISPLSVLITASDQTVTYGNSIVTGTGQVTCGALAYDDELSSITLTASGTDVTASGVITPSDAVIMNGSSDKTSNYTITYNTGKLTITAIDSSIDTVPEAVAGLTYTGEAQALVTAGSASGGTVQYAIGESAEEAPASGWETAIPTGTDAGTYYVWYKVVGDDNHNDTDAVCLTVNIGTKAMSYAAAGYVGVYDGAAHGITVTVTEPEDAEITYSESENGPYTETAPTYTNVGTYTVYYKVTADNYTTVTGSEVVEITQTADNTVTVSIEGWTYGEEANEPTSTATYGADTVVYTYSDAEDGTYTDEVPVNAGTWYIKATVEATDDYPGGEAIASFVIAKASISPEVTIENWICGWRASVPVVTGNLGGGKVTYYYKPADASDCAYCLIKPCLEGTYTVKAVIAETENYEGGEATANFRIYSKAYGIWTIIKWFLRP